MCDSPIELFLLNLFFNWWILALQCCAGFCHITTQFSRNYTYILPLEPPSPPPTNPLGHHRDGAETQQFPVSSNLHTEVYERQCDSFSSCHPLLPHQSVLCVCLGGLPGTQVFLSLFLVGKTLAVMTFHAL